MTQKPYYRDVWALGPNQTGYPGAFPDGFINKVRHKWWGQKRLWMFSGSYKDPQGTTVDLNPAVHPDIIANCEALPLEDEQFDFVLLDPPYSKEEARELYDMEYCSMTKVINEAARVCKPSGHVLVLHRIIPECHPYHNVHAKRLEMVGVVGVYTMSGYSNMRALSVWRKAENMRPFMEAAVSKDMGATDAVL